MSEHHSNGSCENATPWPTVSTTELLVNQKTAIKIGPFGSQLNKRLLIAEGGYKVYGQENVFRRDFSLGSRRVDLARFNQLRSCEILPGDLVLTMAGTIGKCAIVPDGIEEGIMDSHLLRLRVAPRIYCLELLVHIISSPMMLEQIKRLSVGSIMEGLSSTIVKRLVFPNPPLPQQHKIAKILTTVDNQIEKTEALIAKYQAIKQGMMHDLFTRGVDEHGHLRPPYDESAELYKESEFGWIPKEWEAKRLGAALKEAGGFLQTGPFGSQLHAYEYVPEGVPVIMPQDIIDGQVRTEEIARVTVEKAQSMARHLIRPNDIVFSRRGELSRAAAISNREQGWLCGTGCFLLRASPSLIDAAWLAYVYRYDSVQRQVQARAVGSTMPSLNNAVMERLLMAFPPHQEQLEIRTRLQSLEANVRSQLAQKRKLMVLKTGLMQDLLTGKVRVKVDGEAKDA